MNDVAAPRTWTKRWRAPGGGREVLVIALPLILSTSFQTLQITVERILLGRVDPDAVGAALAAALLWWTPLSLLLLTTQYASTFVAQYVGAGRPQRVGPAIWQAIYFSAFAGVAFLGLIPVVPYVVTAHSPVMQELELTYFNRLSFAVLPALLVAATNAFFTGRGDSSKVLLIDGTGFLVNALLSYLLIGGNWGFPRWGIAGAAWAGVVGNWTSAALGFALFLRKRYRDEFATLSGWAFDRELFGRLLRFGLPSGFHFALDGVAFTVFYFLVGRLGDVEMDATGIAFTINMAAFMPPYGLCQAVAVLVGQRLGEGRPDLAERSTWSGFRLTMSYTAVVALLYLLAPGVFVAAFHGATGHEEKWAAVAALVPVLLRFVALYALSDSLNLLFSSALKGAGDTWFVTAASLTLAWSLMVVPTWLAVESGWGLWWCWAALSAYIVVLAFVFLWRFLGGKWKSMRVIETAPPEELANVSSNA